MRVKTRWASGTVGGAGGGVVEVAAELDGGGLWLILVECGCGVDGGGVTELPCPLVVHAARNSTGQRRRINPSSRRFG
jgi:hypothetical protein